MDQLTTAKSLPSKDNTLFIGKAGPDVTGANIVLVKLPLDF